MTVSDNEQDTRVPRTAWSRIYTPAWDDTPQAYVEAGLVAWGRSRRLMRFDDPGLRIRAYAGVQHYDPARWNIPGEARARFFMSLFLDNRTVTLRTFATMADALSALDTFRSQVGSHMRG